MFYVSQMIFCKKMQISLGGGGGKYSDSPGAQPDLNKALEKFFKYSINPTGKLIVIIFNITLFDRAPKIYYYYYYYCYCYNITY
jgi:hypothetical protein